jgi:ankyrin repeat protein
VSATNPPLRTLREHPDLDQLRRQAKELLGAYREHDADAVAEVSHHYRGADPATFALHDAQLVLARAYGFESWPTLKAFVDGATVSRLIAAVRAGDTARVRTILDARPEIVNMDASDNDEHRALHYAVLMRSVDMVRALMERGANPRIGIYPHRIPTTALAIATERRYEEIVAVIREVEEKRTGVPAAGPPADRSPEPLPRELHDALLRGDARAAIAFLESSAEFRDKPERIRESGTGGITILHVASARLMVDLVAWLLDHGADVHARNWSGLRPIDMMGRWPADAAHAGVQEVAHLLLRHGAERSAFWAVATNDLAWLRARHDEGTLNNPTVGGGGLVTYAVQLDRGEALTLLLDFGFDPSDRPGPGMPGGKLPLEECASSRRFALADILLQRGATLTPTIAVALGKGDWLRARHAEGALDHPKEGDGLLTVAVKHDRGDMLQLLLDLGFDVDERRRTVGREGIEESRGNPLDRAAERGNIAIAELLLAHGADPNAGAVTTAYNRHDRAMLDLLQKYDGHVNANTAAYHRDVALAQQRIREEDAGHLPTGAVPPGRTVAEELLAGECGEPEIIRMALDRIDWAPDDGRWYETLKGPLAFWSHIPWIVKPDWQRGRDGYLVSFRLILARCHANVKGSFGRTILHDVMAMGFHDGVSGWVTEEEALAFAVTLLDAGARTDVRDDLLKSTPLGWACRWGRTPIVREILRRGIDAVEPDAEPWATPRAWAETMRNDAVLAALREYKQRRS